MKPSDRHAVLDAIVASFLEANPTKLPSTTTVMELIEWQYRAVVEGNAAPVRCSRCGEFLSATRVEMRLTVCADCDRSHRRR